MKIIIIINICLFIYPIVNNQQPLNYKVNKHIMYNWFCIILRPNVTAKTT